MVERLKTTWTAFGGLTKEEQEFIKQNEKRVAKISDEGICDYSNIMHFNEFAIYRLSPDFQLPAPEPERWLYNKQFHLIHEVTKTDDFGICRDYTIEIPAEDVPYVKKCIELHKQGKVNLGEFEFRKGILFDDIIIFDDMSIEKSLSEVPNQYAFVRKSKPQPQALFVEYPISNEAGQYYCLIGTEVFDKIDNIPIHELPSIVGFAGVRFVEGGQTWHMNTCALVDEFGAFTDYENVNGDRTKPATPIAARFYVKEEK